MDRKQKALWWLLIGCAGPLGAQTTPDAGSLVQQVPRSGLLPRASAPTDSAPPSATRPQGRTVRVTAFQIQGNTLLSTEQLMPSLAPYLNQSLDLAQLEQAAQAVARRYREAGWVVSAYLPAQDITPGLVRIQVEEAKLGALRLGAAEGLRGPQAQAQSYFDALLAPGQPLNADAVERAQRLSSELLGLEVSTTFKKSQTAGATDLDVGLRDKPLLATDLFADNHGARSTGRARLNAMLEWRNPVGGGDIWNMALMHTEGSDSARLGVGLPVGSAGWRVGASLSHYRFHLVSPEFAALDITGSVQSLGLEAAYPLVRQRESSLSLLLNADHKSMDNRSHGQLTSQARTQAATVALQGRQSDAGFGLGAAPLASWA